MRFSYQIRGCSINAHVNNPDILKNLSNEKNQLIEISFQSDEKGITIFTGRVLSENLKELAEFIIYHLRPFILKSIVLTEVECLSFPDEFELQIENEEEIRQAGLPLCGKIGKFAVLRPSCPNVTKEEIEQNFRAVISLSCEELDDSLYWVYLANTACEFDHGISNHDLVKQFRLIWSAFNRIYNLYSGKKYERERIEEFAYMDITIKFFNEQIKNWRFNEHVKKLIDAQLYVKNGKENVSEELRKAKENKNLKEISKYVLLSLYAVRNSLFHGEARKEIELSRVCLLLLSPLVKYVIKQCGQCALKNNEAFTK